MMYFIQNLFQMPGKPRKGLVYEEDYKEEHGVLVCSKCPKSFPHNRFFNLKGKLTFL